MTHITEAEAAARFSLQSTEAKALKLKVSIQASFIWQQTNFHQIGDTIMICDAGGATTDLTSYNIRRLNPLQVVEFVPPLSKSNISLRLNSYV